MIRRLIPVAATIAIGCAYYNGVYNSKAAAHIGDGQLQRGEASSAQQNFLVSAVKADTVLVRHPKTHWRAEALYLAGRGYAFGGNCALGLKRLDAYLAIPGEPVDRRDRAMIARASCLLSMNEVLDADTTLRSLLQSHDSEVRAQAELWDGRVAMAMGDLARAQQLLSLVPGNTATWEFIAAAFSRGDLAPAESLLAGRAQKGDWRPEVPARVRVLWGAGRRAAVVRIVNFYGHSSAPTGDRVALHLLTSDLAAAANDTALARTQAIEAMRVGITPAVEAEARVRLLAIRVREFDALSDVEAAIRRDSATVQGTALIKRIYDDLLLVHYCLAGQNVGGVGVFLAAEIVRDSLHANRLAHAMFRSIERDNPESDIAGRGLLASAFMFPESTQVYQARVFTKWDSSGAAAAMRHSDPSLSRAASEDRALQLAWKLVSARWDSTLKARRTADSLAAIHGGGRQ